MLRSLRIYVLLFILLFVIAACSNESNGEQTKEKENPEEKQEEKFDYPEAAKDAEGIIEQGPGELVQFIQEVEDLESIDEEEMDKKLNDEVKALPSDLSLDQAYDFIIAKMGFPYKEPAEMYDAFNSEYQSPSERAEEEKQKNIVFLLDSSGSMAGQVNGGVKMELAKSALNRVTGNTDPNTKIALRVYGHKGSSEDKDKKVSCDSSELVYPLNPYEEGKFQDALNDFKPSGWTPIATSLELAKDDFNKVGDDVENIVYIISDGVETCDGDPVKAAKEIHESDLDVTVNVIGFNVDTKGQKQLKETAAAGGGEYKDVNSKTDLNKTLDDMIGDVKKNIDEDISEAKAGIDINSWYSTQSSELRKIHDRFIGITQREYGLLKRYINLLSDHEKLKKGAYTDLTDMIKERKEIMESYSQERKDKRLQEVEDSRDKAREELEKKKQQ
ncbi:VWA domain-containing protein [Alkalihalobacillus sp. TS-13]|uniref:vWA domain-containing protein n=1 Tax=Alkalihalobacillus sp. TS-13 TaxID=2842455 RepID=UPI001C86E38A|nr:VWA domain-containing protein [Alkalihalobacillus sp. TS-13]